MANLRKTKKRLTNAITAAKISILKGEDDRVLIDLDGDGKADAVLIDTNDTGTPDVLAFDLTGDNKHGRDDQEQVPSQTRQDLRDTGQ